VIGYAQRTLAVGMTRSGKSTLLAWFFANLRVRRALVDPKGEWQLAGVPRVDLAAHDAAGAEAEVKAKLDPAAPLFHVKPAWLGQPGSREQLTALYAFLDRLRGPLTVWTDEAYGVSNASWAPPGLLSLQVAGAGRGHGHLVATQRPRNIAKELVTEADHVFIFPPLDTEDLIESRRGLPFLKQGDAIELAGEVPEYGYLWADRRERRVDVGDPLPDYLRAHADRTVRRRAAAT
jgi:hypothetical protein